MNPFFVLAAIESALFEEKLKDAFRTIIVAYCREYEMTDMSPDFETSLQEVFDVVCPFGDFEEDILGKEE